MKKVHKICCVLISFSLLVASVYAEDTVVSATSDAPTWESVRAERQAAKEARLALQAEKKAAKESAKAEKLAAKLASMSDEERAAYEAKEAEKKAAAEAKASEKQAKLEEKQALKAEKQAAKDAAKAEKQAAKDAALQEKLDKMTPEQKAKYDAKQAEKAKIKEDIESDRAMRKTTLEETSKKAEIPYFYFDIEEGLELAQVTRIVLKDDRSNFVFNDTLVGAYVNVKTTGFKFVNPMIKASALMGMGEIFNNMKVSTSTFNWGADFLAGLDYKFSFWDYAYLNFAPAFHLLYQDTDRFNYLNMGIAGYASFEMPLAYHWTIALSGQISYDWGNFGSNALLETYDYVWQKSASIGVRYSGRHVNKYNYIGDSAELLQIKKERVQAFKQAKKDAKATKAAERKAASDAKKAASAERKAAEKESQ